MAGSIVARDFGIDGRDLGGQSVTRGLGGLTLSHVLIVAPTIEPSLVVLAQVEIDIEAPVHSLNPIILERVELGDGDAADFGPRTILEGIVVEKLASKKERNREIAPNLALRSLVGPSLSFHGVDSLSKIVHAKKDSCARQSRGSEYLPDKLAEGRRDGSLWSDQTDCHLGNVLGHHVDLIVEDGTHASGHDGR